jgi:hypothetical protein
MFAPITPRRFRVPTGPNKYQDAVVRTELPFISPSISTVAVAARYVCLLPIASRRLLKVTDREVVFVGEGHQAGTAGPNKVLATPGVDEHDCCKL